MPTWTSISPRGGLVYDLFGNQKTALKFSIGRYEQAGTTGFSESYNPLQLATASVVVDRPERRRRPAGRTRLRVSDARLRNQPRDSCRPASAWPAWRTSTRTSSGCTTSRRPSASSTSCVRACRCRAAGTTATTTTCGAATTRCETFADFTPFTLYSPIDGTPITYYNVSAAKVPRHQLRGHHRRRRPEDVVQRLRVQLQRAAAARRHAVRRRHERADARPGLRRTAGTRTCCSTAIRPRAACRSARSSRSPASVPIKYGIQVGVSFQSLPGYGYGTGALGRAATGGRPARAASRRRRS